MHGESGSDIQCHPNRLAEFYRNADVQPETNKVLRHFEFMEFSKDNNLLLGTSDLTGRFWYGMVWFFKNPAVAPSIEDSNNAVGICCDTVSCGKFINDGSKFIIGEDTGALKVFSILDDDTGFGIKQAASLHHQEGAIRSIAISPDGKKFISASEDKSLALFEFDTEQLKHIYNGEIFDDCQHNLKENKYPAHTCAINCVQYHPEDANVFASCAIDGDTVLWDLRKDKPALEVSQERGDPPTTLCFDIADHSRIIVGRTSGLVNIMDVRSPNIPLLTKQVFNKPLRKLAPISISSPEAQTSRYSDSRHADFVRDVAWHPATKELYSCAWDKKILQHTVGGGAPLVNGFHGRRDVSEAGDTERE